ncbi:hypothetical protein P2M38_24150, partial [Klebsiella pneumoniae]|nr:hypothetical protein [Klebsiella pneumoniae]
NRLIRCVCGKKIGPDPRNFNQRVSLGRNDLLIRTFPKGERIRLEEDLINTRMNEDDVSLRGKYIDLKKCFKYRHWLAHGRYWDPKRITEVDFDSIRVLISSILVSTSIEFEID